MLRSARGKELTAKMPRERVLTETDGPFSQIDGRSCLPWDVDKAVTALADLWDASNQGTQAIMDNNLRQLLSRASYGS